MKISLELPEHLSRQIDRIIREGWFASPDAIVLESLEQFVGTKSFLGDSPRLLHRFAADALNESKPETALKFTDRAISLLNASRLPDLGLYQSLVELRVQVLLVLDRTDDALHALEEAREKLPNSPVIDRWLVRVKKRTAAEPV